MISRGRSCAGSFRSRSSKQILLIVPVASSPTYFLLLLVLLSELDVVLALEGVRPPSSVSHVVVCRLFPYMALGAELERGMALSWEEVGVVVAARTGLDLSAIGVL